MLCFNQRVGLCSNLPPIFIFNIFFLGGGLRLSRGSTEISKIIRKISVCKSTFSLFKLEARIDYIDINWRKPVGINCFIDGPKIDNKSIKTYQYGSWSLLLSASFILDYLSKVLILITLMLPASPLKFLYVSFSVIDPRPNNRKSDIAHDIRANLQSNM